MSLSKLPGDPGLPREAPTIQALVVGLINRLSGLLQDIIRRMNLVLDGYSIGVDTLPAAGAAQRGRIAWTKSPSGVADTLDWCRRNRSGAYEWLGLPVILTAQGTWDPPPLSAGGVAAATIAVPGAEIGDKVVAAHDQIGAVNVLISSHVESAGNVRVVVRNETGATLDIPSGMLSVMVFKR